MVEFVAKPTNALITEVGILMAKYDFRVIIANHTTATEEMANAIYEAGGDDATVCSRDGAAFAVFTREASSMDEAISSALRQLVAAGYPASQVEIDQLESLVSG